MCISAIKHRASGGWIYSNIIFHLYATVYEMGSKGRPIFDLNEPPTEDDEDNDDVISFQPQRAVPSSSNQVSDLLPASAGPQGIVNNHAFSHASSVSGFQPFIRSKSAHGSEFPGGKKGVENLAIDTAFSSRSSKIEEMNASQKPDLVPADPQAIEKEEGEWSDAEGSGDVYRSSSMNKELASCKEILQEKVVADTGNIQNDLNMDAENTAQRNDDITDQTGDVSCSGQDRDTNDRKSSSSRNSDGSSMNGQEDHGLVPKQREIKGVEANYAMKYTNNPGKHPRIDQQKEAMLGKKRSRQTMFLNLEDVKQAGTIKSSTPRRQNFPTPVTIRTVKEGRAALPHAECPGDKHTQPTIRESTQVDLPVSKGNGFVEPSDIRSEYSGEMNSNTSSWPRRLNSLTDVAAEAQSTNMSRRSSWKQPVELRPTKNQQLAGRKLSLSSLNSVDSKMVKKLPSKKQPSVNNQYQDTSVERLIREVTNEKFWHHPGSCIAERILQLHLVGIQQSKNLVGWKTIAVILK